MTDGGKQITIRRDRGLYAIFRKLIIRIDGAEMLRIKAGQEKTLTLPPNSQALEMKMDWVTSEPFDLAPVSDGDTLAIYIIKRSFQEMSSIKTIPFAIRIEQG